MNVMLNNAPDGVYIALIALNMFEMGTCFGYARFCDDREHNNELCFSPLHRKHPLP